MLQSWKACPRDTPRGFCAIASGGWLMRSGNYLRDWLRRALKERRLVLKSEVPLLGDGPLTSFYPGVSC